MPRSRDILERFRPAGTPGAASPAGVPADRVAEMAAELEPVIALLSATQEQASHLRRVAEQEAEQLRVRAMARAAAIVAAAHRQTAAERADAALRVSRRVEEENAAALAEAEHAATAVRQRAAEQMPVYLDRVRSAARSALHGGDEAPP